MDTLPLSGVRAVALEQAVSAPFCSRQMADMGADVVKIERPDGGDLARGYDSAVKGESTHFVWLNRGKRSVVLDVKRERGRDALGRLIADADIFVHNLAPGAVERLGFGYAELFASHPRLIWCGISGYGPDGPYGDKKAYDLLVQAESGVISLTGAPGAPAKAGIAIADLTAGQQAYSSILAALIQRARTGQGARIDISMLECLAEWAMPFIYYACETGALPIPAGVRHSTVVPYGAYACADGQVLFAIQNEREWRRFCSDVMQSPALAEDDRFSTNSARVANRSALETLIEEKFGQHSVSEVSALLEGASLPTGRLNDMKSVASHPQLAARGRWTEISSPSGILPALIPPHNLRNTPPRMGAVPALGQHTREVLAEIGFTED